MQKWLFEISASFCVYDEPSADLCLHKDLYMDCTKIKT